MPPHPTLAEADRLLSGFTCLEAAEALLTRDLQAGLPAPNSLEEGCARLADARRLIDQAKGLLGAR